MHDGEAWSPPDSAAVTVREINDNAPIFTLSVFSYSVSEFASVGTVVGVIQATDLDSRGGFGDFVFSITDAAASGTNTNALTTNISTPFALAAGASAQEARIVVSGPLDREAASFYSVAVRATDTGGLVGEARAVLSVLDENDNAPIFLATSYAATIAEGHVGVVEGLVLEARDADTQDNGRVSYITPPVDAGLPFVFSVQGRGRFSQLIIAVDDAAAVDYEARRSYTFNVTARDNGASRQYSATTTVTVTVTDVNDNAPVLAPPVAAAAVREDAAADGSTTILTVSATDADEGANAEVMYSLTVTPPSAPGAGPVFVINQSGAVVLAGPLDYEAVIAYSLTIRASNPDSDPELYDEVSTVVTVLDVNDNAPVFTATGPTNDGNFSLLEGDVVGRPVAVLRVSDADSGLNGDLSFRLEVDDGDASVGGVFDLRWARVAASGNVFEATLRTLVPLDREAREVYRFAVTALDRGTPQRHTMLAVTVTVLDLNDEAPVFEGEAPGGGYAGEVPEDAGTDARVVSVRARDVDGAARGTVGYAIVGGTDLNGQFKVDLEGVVRVARPLDYETQRAYTLIINASDGGQPRGTAQTVVVVDVLDVNDNAPVFAALPAYQDTYAENSAPIALPVITLQATDKDSPPNANITYAIVSGNTPGDVPEFSLGGSNGGALYLDVSALDRERQERYTVIVRASDNGWPVARTAEVTLVFKVDDANDNAPVFVGFPTQPPGVPVVVQLPEAAVVGTVIADMAATDADEGRNAVLDYLLTVEGGADGDITINASSGLVTVAGQGLDYERRRSYALTVTASDRGRPEALSTTLSITLLVVDVNDNAPVFLHGNISLAVPLGTSHGVTLGYVRALDADSARNGAVRYALAPPHALLAIDASSGAISARADLLAAGPLAPATVVASDDGSPLPRTAAVTVHVTVAAPALPELLVAGEGVLAGLPAAAVDGRSVTAAVAARNAPGADVRASATFGALSASTVVVAAPAPPPTAAQAVRGTLLQDSVWSRDRVLRVFVQATPAAGGAPLAAENITAAFSISSALESAASLATMPVAACQLGGSANWTALWCLLEVALPAAWFGPSPLGGTVDVSLRRGAPSQAVPVGSVTLRSLPAWTKDTEEGFVVVLPEGPLLPTRPGAPVPQPTSLISIYSQTADVVVASFTLTLTLEASPDAVLGALVYDDAAWHVEAARDAISGTLALTGVRVDRLSTAAIGRQLLLQVAVDVSPNMTVASRPRVTAILHHAATGQGVAFLPRGLAVPSAARVVDGDGVSTAGGRLMLVPDDARVVLVHSLAPSTSVSNTAMINGVRQHFPLQVAAVRRAGAVEWTPADVRCLSNNDAALQVQQVTLPPCLHDVSSSGFGPHMNTHARTCTHMHRLGR